MGGRHPVTIRLGQCFSSMPQMWSDLARPAGGGTELEPPEPSSTKYGPPLTRDESPNLSSWFWKGRLGRESTLVWPKV